MTKEVLNSFIKFNNHNVVEELMSYNKGIFILSGHLSNWELMAFAYSKVYNSSLKIIAKIQASKGLNEKINEYRESGGNEIIPIGLSLREIFTQLRKNEIVCFLVDQSANPDYSVYVNFFGQKAATFTGPAKLALKERPGLVVAYGIRNPDYSYLINFEKIDYDEMDYDKMMKYDDENIMKLTQKIQTRFEEIIREYPDQWLWFHKRFKHLKK